MKKQSKLLSLVLTLCMVITMIPNIIFAQENLSSGDIVIMHTNDIHSRVDENLSYATVKAWKDYFKTQGNDVLLLDAGDTLHGLPIANLSNGENIVDIMNAVGYDAMTAGNHDFNYGMNQLINLKNKMNFDFLVSNITKDGNTTFIPSNIYERAGKKIGVIGIATPESATKTNPANVEGYSFNEDKLADIVQKEINNLESQDVDYIIALGHLGIDSESSPYMSTELISKVDGLDIFIDGHSHNELPKGQIVKDKDGQDVVLAQTGNYLKNIGKIVIKEDGTITASFIENAASKTDETVNNLITSMKNKIQPELDKKVGYTSVLLDGSRDPGVRTKETNLANLVTDALKYASGADVALTNGGGIRASVDVGDITYGELNAVLPFGNVVTKIEVTGQQILEALQHGTSSSPGASGAFPQVSGISYEIHAYLKENKVKNVKINGEELDLNKTYTLATNDFTAVGGDGYDMFKSAKKLGEYGAMDEALVNYIAQELNGVVGEEYAKEQGRITIYTSVDEVPSDKEEETPDEDNKGETPDEDDKGETPDGDDKGETPDEDNKGEEDAPETGDKNMVAVYAIILAISASVFGAVVINRKKIVNK